MCRPDKCQSPEPSNISSTQNTHPLTPFYKETTSHKHILLPFRISIVKNIYIYSHQGFAFPPEAGYPFESTAIDRFYLMESHYNNPNPDGDLAALHLGPVVDNSGLKLFFTTIPRKHDAGVISIGKQFFVPFRANVFVLFQSSYHSANVISEEFMRYSRLGIYYMPVLCWYVCSFDWLNKYKSIDVRSFTVL